MTETLAAPRSSTETAERPLRRNRPYLLIMSGLSAQSLGAGLAAFAVPLLAYGLTGSAFQAGVITAVGQLGAVLATLPAGVLADRTDRRRLVVVAASVGALLWASVGVAALAGHLTAVHLAGVLLGSSVVSAFVDPAISGAFRSVVPQAQLPSATAAAQGRDAVADLLAGPVGGLLYGMAHALPLLAGAVGHVATAVCTWLVREPLNGDVAEARAERPADALRAGLRYVWSRSLFRASLVLFVVINVALNGMLVAINLELVRTGTAPVLIGMINLVLGVSLLVGALLAPALVRRVRVGVLVMSALGLVAVGAVVMAALHTYAAYLVVLGLMTLLVPAANAALAGYGAAITPTQMQGRFSSVMGLTGLAAGPLFPLAGGGLLEAAGVGTALAVLAGLVVVTVVALGFVRSLWRIGLPATWADDALPVP